jgi:hypothetical protein
LKMTESVRGFIGQYSKENEAVESHTKHPEEMKLIFRAAVICEWASP